MKTIILPEPIRGEGRRFHEGHVLIADVTYHRLTTLKKWWRCPFYYFTFPGTVDNAIRTLATLDLFCLTNESTEVSQP